VSAIRLAADIGGTFTDLALEADGRLYTLKLLTTHHAPEQAVLEGAETVLAQAGLQRGDVKLFVHGTTLATNAMIERRGAPTALLTTEGFRDTLELGTESRFDQYDLSIQKPAPLVPRQWRFAVPERLAADGSVLLDLDRNAVRQAALVMKVDGIHSVAVCFLHSYANPVHEQAAAAILAETCPDLLVSLSSEISPEMREWERFSTTAANAYVQPVMARYLGRLRDTLAEQGYRCPLFLMLSSGDLTTVDLAIRFPVRLVESGPAGGAIFAAGLARGRGLHNVLSFDMGGTTAKLCLVHDGAPVLSRVFEVARSHRDRRGSGLPLRIPVVEMVEIGAGGGSIARRDALGRIRVGPDSAGSDPGPACYGRGGTQPTVSDADLLLGRLSPAGLAGGSVRLDPACAAQAMAVIGQDPVTAAYGVSEIVDEAMAAAARQHAAEQGATTEGRAMIAFGGAAPLHAARLAEKLGADAVLVPRHAGVGSAIGFLRAPIAFSVSRSLPQRLSRFQVEPVNAVLETMAAATQAAVALGAPAASRTETRQCFARYVGQAHEIAVPLPARALLPGEAAEISAAFDRAYAEQYGQTIPGMDIEVLTWSVRVAAAAEITSSAPPHHAVEAIRTGTRDVFDPGTARLHPFVVVARDTLRVGDRTAGPALVTEDETTTVVPPGWTAAMEADGGLMLRQDRT
jgi:N-methylhydantoinase A